MSNCPVYRAASATFAAANGTAPFLTFAGSASGIVTIHRIFLYSPTLVTSGFVTLSVGKYSEMPTGGTAITLTNVPSDSDYGASGSVINVYTVAPSGGTSIGRIATNRFYSHKVTPTADGINQSLELLESQGPEDYIVLRNENEGIAVYCEAAPGGVLSLSASVEWCEE